MFNILFFMVFELFFVWLFIFMVFLIFWVMYGVVMGGIWGVVLLLVMEIIFDCLCGLMLGIFQVGYFCGYLFVLVIFGFFYSMVGWCGMFLIGVLFVVLLFYIWFKVLEFFVWLVVRVCKENIVLFFVLCKQWKLCLYLVLVMVFFNFFSYGMQDFYFIFLKMQYGFDLYLISIIVIFYNIVVMFGGIFYGMLLECIGCKKVIMIVVFFVFLVFLLWVFFSGLFMIGLGVFLMQFMVQGVWGVVLIWLNELVLVNVCVVLSGFVY